MKQKQPSLYLLTALLFLSFLLPEARMSRSLASVNRETLSVDEKNQVANLELPEEEEGFVEGRMIFESSDYPVSGANSRHEPKSPGRP